MRGCDICLAEKKLKIWISYLIDFGDCYFVTESGPHTGRPVNAIKVGAENEILDRIRELLDAGKIKTDGKIITFNIMRKIIAIVCAIPVLLAGCSSDCIQDSVNTLLKMLL